MATKSSSLATVPLTKLSGVARVQSAKPITVKFPKRRSTKRTADKAAKSWRATRAVAAKAGRNPQVRVKAIAPSRARFTALRKVAESPAAPSTLIDQRIGPAQLFGTLFSALATHEFIKLEAEYRRRRHGSPAAIAKVDAQWKRHVADFGRAFARAGLRGVNEVKLRKFARDLRAVPANYTAVLKIAASAVPAGPQASIGSGQAIVASFVPQFGTIIDPSVIVTPIRTLCATPLSQGTFTKHLSYSVSLSVSIKYPCGISWSGIKWCTKKVTLAGVSFALDLNVGYKVTCCGATVWGQVAGQACATILGKKVCASCTATVTGVAGISRTPVAGGCSYGLGINASLKCTFAGATILNMSYPFGWTITGPCPPAGVCA